MDVISVINSLAALFSIVALFLSISTYRDAKRDKAYSDLDELYIGLYRAAMEKTFVLNPKKTWDYKNLPIEERLTYQCYVYQVWMICETIFDKASSGGNFETWETVFETEARLHISWFFDDAQKETFKNEFKKYMVENYENRIQELKDLGHKTIN